MEINQMLYASALVMLGFSSIANFTMGAVVLRRFPRSFLHVSYFLLTFFLGCWSLLNFLWVLSPQYQTEFLDRATFACLPLVNTFFLMFAAFSPRHGRQKLRAWMGAVFILMLVSVGLCFTPLVLKGIEKGGWGHISIMGPLMWPFAFFWISVFLAGIIVLHEKLRRAKDPFDRIRLKYLVVGAWIPFILGPPIYIIPYAVGLPGMSAFIPIVLPAVSSFSMIANVYAIMRYRLLDVNLAGRNATITITLAILQTAAIGFLVYEIVMGGEVRLISPAFIALVMIVFSVVLFYPYLNGVIASFVGGVFFPGTKTQEEAVQHFSARLPGLRGLDELSREICSFLRSAFHSSGVVIYSLEPAGEPCLKIVVADPADFSIELTPVTTGALVAFSESLSSCLVSRYEIEVQGSRHPLYEALPFFIDKGVDVFIPLSSAGRCIGGIFIGQKIRGGFYNEESMQLLQQLAEMIVPSLLNACLDERIAESHRRYRELFERAGDAILIVSEKDGIICETNSRAEELFALSRDGLIGKNISSFFSNDAMEKNAGGQDKDSRAKEIALTRGDGRQFPAEVHSVALEGQIIVNIVRDLTEKKMFEEELLKLKKIESLGVLAGGIAHDFNNILTAIMGCVSYAKLVSSGRDNEVSQILEKAEKASNEAKGLTRQLLTFSKGGAPVVKAAYIGDILKDTAVFTLRGSCVGFETSIPDDLWPVDIDESQISQVVQNLVINSAQAMPGGGKVCLKAENIALESQRGIPLPDGRYVKVTVSDNGCGIAAEDMQKIFDPYFTTKSSGNGLGLAIAFSILRKHSGHIMAESLLGTGSNFTFFLPASEQKLVERKNASGQLERGAGRILVMDDNDMVRELVEELLLSIGYRVKITSDGEEAVAAYDEAMRADDPFDIVVLDLTVPGGMGGREAIKKLIELDPDVTAVVSSGYFSDPVMSEYRRHGFKAVVCKPFGIEELSSTLRALMEGKS